MTGVHNDVRVKGKGKRKASTRRTPFVVKQRKDMVSALSNAV